MLFFFIPVDRLIEFLLGERLHDFAAKGSGFRKSVEIAACMRAHFADGCIFALLNDKAVKMLLAMARRSSQDGGSIISPFSRYAFTSLNTQDFPRQHGRWQPRRILFLPEAL